MYYTIRMRPHTHRMQFSTQKPSIVVMFNKKLFCLFYCFLFVETYGEKEVMKKDHHYYILTPKKATTGVEPAPQPAPQPEGPAPQSAPQSMPQPLGLATHERKSPSDSESESSSSDGYSERSSDSDEDYKPLPEDESSSSSSSNSDEESTLPLTLEDVAIDGVTSKKFMVFEGQLYDLLRHSRCRQCGKVLLLEGSIDDYISVEASALSFKAECIEGHPFQWRSQPVLGIGNAAMYAGNLLLSAALLFSGNQYAKVSHFASLLNLGFISSSSYTNHQKDYLFPAVHESWTNQRAVIWEGIKAQGVLHIGGDGRCDSPGYSAKFGTYSVMDLNTNLIVDTETVAVSEVTSSNAMEKEGCMRVLQRLLDADLNLQILCTDRHLSIQKMMRTQFADITHQFDVWHLGKSVARKLTQKAKRRETEELMGWIPAIKNHLWFSSSTCEGDEVKLVERWQSLSQHITNKHSWDQGQTVHECAHADLREEEEEVVKWLDPESPAHVELNKVLFDNKLVEDIKKLNYFCHTGNLENFNSLMTKYCPKRSGFGYEGMVARSRLAAMDHNANVGREQAVVNKASATSAEAGAPRFALIYAKATHKWTIKRLLVKKSYDFLSDLMVDVLVRKLEQRKDTTFHPPELPKNIAPQSAPKPTKEEAIARYVSRFK